MNLDPWAKCFLSDTDEYAEGDRHFAIVNRGNTGRWSAQLNDKDTGESAIKHGFATKAAAKAWCEVGVAQVAQSKLHTVSK